MQIITQNNSQTDYLFNFLNKFSKVIDLRTEAHGNPKDIAVRLVETWSNWQPHGKFVAPSFLSYEYGEQLKKKKLPELQIPLYHYAELNDIAAVIAGKKPAALIDYTMISTPGIITDIFNELMKMGQSKGISYLKYKRENDETEQVFVAPTNQLQQIKNLFSVKNEKRDHSAIGKMFGYPEENIQAFISNDDSKIPKAKPKFEMFDKLKT